MGLLVGGWFIDVWVVYWWVGLLVMSCVGVRAGRLWNALLTSFAIAGDVLSFCLRVQRCFTNIG